MIFARLDVDGKVAYGVFASRNDASNALFDWAGTICCDLNPRSCSYSDKPYGEMTIEDDLDCYPLKTGKVLVL